MERINALRRSPKTLFRPGAHSHLLSEHPIKMKNLHEEQAAVQANLAARGRFDAEAKKAAEAMEEKLAETKSHKAFVRSREYRWYLGSAMSGHLLASYLVYGFYYADGDARLGYDPVNGFVEELKVKRAATKAEDEFFQRQIASHVAPRTARYT